MDALSSLGDVIAEWRWRNISTSVKRLVRALPDEALCFFVSFSRFEYALKRAHFVRLDQERAEPDWDRFADELGQSFFTEVCESGVARDLVTKPP
jgi:hypothetical protein